MVFVKMSIDIEERELFKFYSKFGNVLSSQIFSNFPDYKIGLIIYDNEVSSHFALNQTKNLLWKGYRIETFYLFNRLYKINKHNSIYIKVKSTVKTNLPLEFKNIYRCIKESILKIWRNKEHFLLLE